MKISKEIWQRNDQCVLEKLGIIKFIGDQWNSKWKYPLKVSPDIGFRLKAGYYQEGCRDMKIMQKRMDELYKRQTSILDLKDPIYTNHNNINYLMANIHNISAMFIKQREKL